MSVKKDLFPTRGELRGNVLAGMLDQALITTRTHSQWDTSGLTGNNTLIVEIDGYPPTPVTFPVQPVLKVEDLIGLINTAFTGVAVVATQVFGGYMRLASSTQGRESKVDISASPGPALALFQFNETLAIGRQIDDAPPNDGLEDNPPRTRMIGTGEPEIQEVVNRPSIALASMLEGVIGQLGTEYAVPKFSSIADSKTMDDLGAPRAIKLASAPTTWPALGSSIEGRDSGTSATLQNIVQDQNGDYWFVITNYTGGFQLNEDISDSPTTPTTYAVYGNQTNTDDRIIAIKLDGSVYVGVKDVFGSVPPTIEQLERLFQLSIEGHHTARNAAVKSELASKQATLPTYGLEVPLRTGGRSRVSMVVAGLPTSLTPTLYDYNGIRRQAPTNIDDWTKSSVKPNGGTASFSDKVSEGDILIITGSPAPGSPHLNNGKYAIRGFNAGDQSLGIYRIGPQRSADSGLDLPEDVLPDPELYEHNDTTGAQVEVRSPSYVLNSAMKDDAGADRSCWLMLDTPAHEDDVITASYYEVMNDPGRRPGIPEMESPWAQKAQGRADELEDRLANFDLTSFAQGRGVPMTVREDVSIHSYRWADLLLHAKGRALLLSLVSGDNSQNLDGDSIEPKSPPLMAATYVQQLPRGLDEPGPVLNMYRRKVKVALQEFDWSTQTGTLTPGMVLTGSTSGATIMVYSPTVQGKNSFLGMVTSGEPEPGEDLTGTGVTVGVISHMKFYGFVFELPEVVASQTEQLGTINQNGDVVSWPGPSDPALLEYIKSGDVLWATSDELSNHKWRARILYAAPSPTRQLKLEVVQPYGLDPGPSTADFTWKVTPDIGNYECLSGTGAHGMAGTPFIALHEPPLANPNKESNPHLHGIGPGDILVIGTTVEYVVKRLVARQGTISIVEVETFPTSNFSSQGWQVISKHHKTQSTHRDWLKYDSLDGESYDTARGVERWVLEGPSYVHVPVNGYGTPHKGGINLSGLNGKSLTFRVLNGVELLREATITFTSSPGSVRDLATAINALLTANDDWVKASLSYGDKYALILHTVAKESYDNSGGTTLSEHGVVGPTITLEVVGSAWDAMVYGNPEVKHGNLSEVLWPTAYSESSAHVVPDKDFPGHWEFQWEGAASLIVPRAEFGADYRKDTNYKRSGVGVIHAHDNFPPVRKGSTFPGAQQGVMLDDVQSTLHLVANNDYSYLAKQQTALEVSAGGEPQVRMTHSGEQWLRKQRHMLTYREGGGKPDSLGQEGSLPQAVYSGPIHIYGSWENHRLGLITSLNDYRIHDFVDFTTSETTLALIVDRINSSLGSDLTCDIDDAGTGFVIRFNRAVSPEGPYHNERMGLVVDPAQTTLLDVFDVDDAYFENGGKTPIKGRALAPWLASYTSIASSFGAAGGHVVDRAGGRRLEVPSVHPIDDGSIGTLREEVWWEENAGSLDYMRAEVGSITEYETSAASDMFKQAEAYVISGGPRPGSGSLLLYQFSNLSGHTDDLEEGADVSRLVYNGGSPEERDYALFAHTRKVSTPGEYGLGWQVRLARSPDTEALHPGGERLSSSITGGVAIYNPTVVYVTNVLNQPTWVLGQNVNCLVDGGASGIYAGHYTAGARIAYVIVRSDAELQSSFTDTTKSWHGTLSSVEHPTFSADIIGVDVLDSNVLDGGPLKPVMALAYRSLNPHDEILGKPIVLSYGDFVARKDGEYAFHNLLPTEWPVKEDPSESYLLASKVAKNGRTFCAEQLAERGRAFKSGSMNGVYTETYQEVVLPAQGLGMAAPTAMDVGGDHYYSELIESDITVNDDLEVVWEGTIYPSADPIPNEKSIYTGVTFHVPVPPGFTWVEGFGAYLRHTYQEVASVPRHPTVVSLWQVGEQDKRGNNLWGSNTPGYRHRLEVQDTGGSMIRVDSAGGGSDNQAYPGRIKPLWSGTAQWAPFRPFMVNRGKSLELYVDKISGSRAPQTGDTIFIKHEGKIYKAPIAYVEEYGSNAGRTAYRFIVYQEGFTTDVSHYPYPRRLESNAIWPEPNVLMRSPWSMFKTGELVRWEDPTSPTAFATGRVAHMDSYDHGGNLRIKVYLNMWKDDGINIYRAYLGGVFVRFRCDRLSLGSV